MKRRRNCGETLDSPPEPAPENERYYSDPLLSAVLGSAAHFFFYFFLYFLSPSTLSGLGYGKLESANVNYAAQFVASKKLLP